MNERQFESDIMEALLADVRKIQLLCTSLELTTDTEDEITLEMSHFVVDFRSVHSECILCNHNAETYVACCERLERVKKFLIKEKFGLIVDFKHPKYLAELQEALRRQ